MISVLFHRFASFFFASATAVCLHASPSISTVVPRSVQPGKRSVLALTGSQLDRVTNLWTSLGVQARQANATNDTFLFELECPADASGVAAIQAHGPDGVSDFQLILVDPFPVTNAAELASKPVAVDSAFRSEQVDRYGFSAKAGEEISIEVLAHRIGSQADPVARVLDSEGRELAFCDDEDGVWRDARFRFRAPLSGSYTLAVHDVGFGGGSGFFYRVRLGEFPIVWTQFPLRDWTEPGTVAPGPKLAGASPANPDGTIWFSSAPMVIEHEPNDSSAQAQEFSPPVILNGRFASSQDRDWFRFRAAKDQKITFQRQSRSLGSPCDVSLRIYRPDASLLAETDGRTLDEALLTRTFDTAGMYLLEVRELTGTAPANAPYRVQVRNWIPSFRLSTDTSKLEAGADRSAKLKITCERLDYDGEIELESAAVELGKSVVAAGRKDAEIVVKLPSETEFTHFQITGKATNGFTTVVSTRPALRKNFPLMLIPPPELDGKITIGLKR